jgi:hypothetical protein
MAGFPSPFPTNNPYLDAARDAGNGAASLVNALQAAVVQKQRLAQQQDNREFQEQDKLRGQGGIPLWIESTDAPADPSMGAGRKLMVRNPAVPANGKGQISSTERGTQFYMPTAEELEALKRGPNVLRFTKEQADDFNKALHITNIRPETDYEPSFGLQLDSAFRAHNEAMGRATKDAQEDWQYIGANGGYVDADGNPVPVFVGKKYHNVVPANLQPGDLQTALSSGSPDLTQAAPQQSDGTRMNFNSPFSYVADSDKPSGGRSISDQTLRGGLRFQPKAKPEKAHRTEPVQNTFGPNGGPIMRDLDTDETFELKLPPGSTRETKGRNGSKKPTTPRDMSPGAARIVEQTKQRKIAAANTARDKGLVLAKTPPQQAAVWKKWKQANQAAQKGYEETIRTSTGNAIPHDPWADNLAEEPAATAPHGTPRKPLSAIFNRQ